MGPLQGGSGHLGRGPAGLGNRYFATSHATGLSQMHDLPCSRAEDGPSPTSPNLHLCGLTSSVSFMPPLPSARAPKLKRLAPLPFSPSSPPPPPLPGPDMHPSLLLPELFITIAPEQVNPVLLPTSICPANNSWRIFAGPCLRPQHSEACTGSHDPLAEALQGIPIPL